MGEKIFKTLDEQLAILRGKNLIINDEDAARNVLFRENYFFLSGYRHLFMQGYKDNKFLPGTKFEEVYATFVFDRKLRNMMFKYILVIENNIKSIISYQLSKRYGYKEADYLNESNFDQTGLKAKQVHDVISKIKRQVRINGKQHTATQHYINNYGYIPMWVLVKVLSMGIVAEFFSILKNDDQKSINDFYRLDSDTLIIYLSLLSNYRNLCAHEEIFYDYRPQKTVPNTRFHKMLNITTTEGEYDFGKNDLFSLIIIFKQMLDKNEFKELLNEIDYEIQILDGKVDTVPLGDILNKMGFPTNWKDIANID